MTKCRCHHNVPWFWTCLECLYERDASGWQTDTWDGFTPVRLIERINETDRMMLTVPWYPTWLGCRVES